MIESSTGSIGGMAAVKPWKFCPQCSKELGAGWKFCPDCGEPIGSSQAVHVIEIRYVPYVAPAPIYPPLTPVQPYSPIFWGTGVSPSLLPTPPTCSGNYCAASPIFSN